MYNPTKPIQTLHDCSEYCDFLKYLVMHIQEGSPMFKSIHEFTTKMQTDNLVRYRGC
jgi:hypothetical protein